MVVMSMFVTLPEVLPAAAMVGRLADVVKMVVPLILTSKMADEPVGDVPRLARTPTIVQVAPLSLYSRWVPVWTVIVLVMDHGRKVAGRCEVVSNELASSV